MTAMDLSCTHSSKLSLQELLPSWSSHIAFPLTCAPPSRTNYPSAWESVKLRDNHKFEVSFKLGPSFNPRSDTLEQAMLRLERTDGDQAEIYFVATRLDDSAYSFTMVGMSSARQPGDRGDFAKSETRDPWADQLKERGFMDSHFSFAFVLAHRTGSE
jgi:hypothetical protein